MPAMPVTTVRKTTGVMIILTSLMKPSPSGFSARPAVGPEPADEHAERDADQDLEIERAPERPRGFGHHPLPGALAAAPRSV